MKHCLKGDPCGETCIEKSDVCHSGLSEGSDGKISRMVGVLSGGIGRRSSKKKRLEDISPSFDDKKLSFMEKRGGKSKQLASLIKETNNIVNIKKKYKLPDTKFSKRLEELNNEFDSLKSPEKGHNHEIDWEDKPFAHGAFGEVSRSKDGKFVKKTVLEKDKKKGHKISKEEGLITERYIPGSKYSEDGTSIIMPYLGSNSVGSLLEERHSIDHITPEKVEDFLGKVIDFHRDGLSHNDLHSFNMMVDDKTGDMSMIDFGQSSKISRDEDGNYGVLNIKDFFRLPEELLKKAESGKYKELIKIIRSSKLLLEKLEDPETSFDDFKRGVASINKINHHYNSFISKK